MSKAVKTALVTGAATRLGAEIAVALAENGWNIAIHHNNSSPEKTLARVKKTGVKTTAIKADLLDIAQVKTLIPEAKKQLGEITLLVNSASIFEHIKFMESDENAYDTHMDIHVKAPFFLSQEFALQCHKGQIINIIDSAATKNQRGHFAYFLSKKSLHDLTKMLAAELGPAIQVNAIFPGPIHEFSDNLDQEYLKRRIEQLPQKKLATAKEITGAIIALTNTSKTGQEVFVDGGEHLI